MTPSPVQHFWSLSVEEQFYVIWPLLLHRPRARRPPAQPAGRGAGPRDAGDGIPRVVGVVLAHLATAGVLHDDHPRSGSSASARCSPWPWPDGPDRGHRRGAPRRSGGWRSSCCSPSRWRCPRGSTGRARGPCSPRCPRRCSSGSAGRVRRTARYGCSGSADGVGRRPVVLDLPLALAGHRPRRVDGRGRRGDGAGLGRWPPGPGLLLPAWLSWRFIESPIHHGRGSATGPRALLAAGSPCRASGCSPPCRCSPCARPSPPRRRVAPCPRCRSSAPRRFSPVSRLPRSTTRAG